MNYTYLRVGDQLPTVGILQKLLNRTGAKLDPDGTFGHKTLAAVRHFQHAKRLNPDGIVGKHTWPRLTEGLHLPIFDCVDVFDTIQKQDLSSAAKKLLQQGDKKNAKRVAHAANEMGDAYAGEVGDIRAVGGTPFLIGGMSNGVQQTVLMIRSAASNAFLLRFHGHGRPGSQGVGGGSRGPHEFNRINTPDQEACSFPQLHEVISHLKGIFGPYGSVQLMGCNTGHGNEGSEFLKALAYLIEVPVTAGRDDQYAGDGVSTFKFEGLTRTAIPGGQPLKAWCRALPDLE